MSEFSVPLSARGEARARVILDRMRHAGRARRRRRRLAAAAGVAAPALALAVVAWAAPWRTPGPSNPAIGPHPIATAPPPSPRLIPGAAPTPAAPERSLLSMQHARFEVVEGMASEVERLDDDQLAAELWALGRAPGIIRTPDRVLVLAAGDALPGTR
jgi:hypothetical protein